MKEEIQIQIIVFYWRNQFWKKIGNNTPERITKAEYWEFYDKSQKKSGEHIKILPPLAKNK
jgi:hypothetical protein